MERRAKGLARVAEPESRTNGDLEDRFQSILASKGLTLYQVSQRSEALFGRSSPYFVPHNLYYDLRLGTFSPSLYQFSALSRISGYRLSDWLRVFGFELEHILRLQVLLPSNQTIRLDSSLEDPESRIPWFRNKAGNTGYSPIAPLVELLEPTHPQRVHVLSGVTRKRYLYIKIGLRDALAFPDLLAGSLVRVNPQIPDGFLRVTNGEASKHWFLLEHGGRLCCSRLQILEGNRVMPVNTLLPCPEIELQLPAEARILGVADLEIRPLVRVVQPEIPREWAKNWRPTSSATELSLKELLRTGRTKMGLSFRQASSLSRKIAELLGHEQYFVSPSSLANYESADSPPRHFHKVITLCVLYAVQFHTFLRSAGIVFEETGREPIPDHLIPRPAAAGFDQIENEDEKPSRRGFLGALLGEVEEVPFFLRRSVDALSGLTAPSLQDFFWIGGERLAIHPYLKNGLLVIVNRRKKTPLHFRSKPLWEQPLYMLLTRDGTYLCGCCRVENRTLIVYPYSRGHDHQERFRYRQDAEIVGEIVTIARRLA